MDADLPLALEASPSSRRLGRSFFAGPSRRAIDVLKGSASTSCGEAAKTLLAAVAALLAAAASETTEALGEMARRDGEAFCASGAPQAWLALAEAMAPLELLRGEAQAFLLLLSAVQQPEKALAAFLYERERNGRTPPAPAVAFALSLLLPALSPGWTQDRRLEAALARSSGSAPELVEAARRAGTPKRRRESDDGGRWAEQAVRELERHDAQAAKARRVAIEALEVRARAVEERAQGFEDVVRRGSLERYLEEVFEGAAAAAEVAAELPKLRAFAETVDLTTSAAVALPFVNSLRRRLRDFGVQARALLDVKRASLLAASSMALVKRETATELLRAVNAFAVARGFEALPDVASEDAVERLALVLRDAPALLASAMQVAK